MKRHIASSILILGLAACSTLGDDKAHTGGTGLGQTGGISAPHKGVR
jgi:hypothetical protein